jgi:methionyl-tRNA formyltransferase
MKIGILFNCNDNNFYPYLTWIKNCISKSKNTELCITKILVNNLERFKKFYPELCSFVVNDINIVLNASDIVFSLGYWQILKQNQIDTVKIGIVNFHHSYKLKYKGRHSSTWVIRNNEKTHGSTMHFIDEKVDEGKIIDSKFFDISTHDTAEIIFEKANKVGLEMLSKNFKKLISDQVKHTDINNLNEKSYKYRKRDLKHEISLSKLIDEEQLYREVRALAFDNKPAPYIIIQGKKIYLKLEEYDDGILKKNNDNKK